MRNYFLIALTLFLGSVFSQNKSIDSLLKVLNTAKEDTNKVKILYKLSEECDIGDVLKYAQPCLQLSEKLNYKRGVADAHNNIGFFYFSTGRSEKGLEHLYNSLKLQQEINNKPGMASALFNMALIYRGWGQLEKALELNIKALKIKEELGDKVGIARSLNNMAAMCLTLGQKKEALEYFLRALKIQEETKNESGAAYILSNMGGLYEDLGQLEKALEYYTKANVLSERTQNKTVMASALNGIGTVYDKMGQPERSLEYFIRLVKISEEINDKRGGSYGLINIGGYYLGQKKYSQAESYFNKALALGKQIGDVEIQQHASLRLSTAYAGLGKYNLAYQTQIFHKQMADSLNNQEVQKAVVKKQMNYEFEKKEMAAKLEQAKKDAVVEAEKKQQQFILWAVSGLAIFILIIAALMLTQNKARSEQRSAQLEQKLLRSQMNPHFIFNSLTAIESFIYKNEPKAAGKYLSGFARLMRLILENSREEYVTLEKEIQSLEHYLNLQKLRYDDQFDYEITIDQNIAPALVSIPPMLAQPFIENSIEHGLKGLPHKGKIIIRFTLNGDQLQFEVEDNGIGFERSLQVKEENAKHKSLATTITLERLNILNRKKEQKIKWVAEDLKDALNKITGARVIFTIPFQNA